MFTDDAAATIANLVEQESLGRLVIALELGIVVTQALVAVWFYRLFRSVDSVTAGALTAFGLVNATVILVSAAVLRNGARAGAGSTGDALARSTSSSASARTCGASAACYSGSGWCRWVCWCSAVPASPVLWGGLLLGGGVGYVLSAFVAYLAPGAQLVADVLTFPATMGEVWMIGYLLHGDVFRGPPAEA